MGAFLGESRLTLVGVFDLGNVVCLGKGLSLGTITSSDCLYDDFGVGFGGADQG